MLTNFLGVLPILTSPLCALTFIMCSKSNPLVVFALDLISTYEGERMIFGLLGQANLTQNDIMVYDSIRRE
jgi:ethanolamine utilization protein EutQ (cupin superfamily)